MSAVDVLALAERLSDRDRALLRTLRAHRLATTAQLRRWHFATGFQAQVTATRSAQRTLQRLERHRLVARLSQRVGGVRRGADSVVWQLDVTGDRLLSRLDGDQRRRYTEPRQAFLTHTVAVTELAVRLVEASHRHQLAEVQLTGEPDNWHRFLGRHGQPEILKPDLTAITAAGDYEDHWMLERDLSTEHPSVIVRKAQVYERFAATGAYQDAHGVVPAVLWIVPGEQRRRALTDALRRARSLTPGVHRVATDHDFLTTVLAGSEPGSTT